MYFKIWKKIKELEYLKLTKDKIQTLESNTEFNKISIKILQDENRLSIKRIETLEHENELLKNKLENFEKKLLYIDYITKVLSVKTNLSLEDEKKNMLWR